MSSTEIWPSSRLCMRFGYRIVSSLGSSDRIRSGHMVQAAKLVAWRRMSVEENTELALWDRIADAGCSAADLTYTFPVCLSFLVERCADSSSSVAHSFHWWKAWTSVQCGREQGPITHRHGDEAWWHYIHFSMTYMWHLTYFSFYKENVRINHHININHSTWQFGL
jgi:hypothetical protein